MPSHPLATTRKPGRSTGICRSRVLSPMRRRVVATNAKQRLWSDGRHDDCSVCVQCEEHGGPADSTRWGSGQKGPNVFVWLFYVLYRLPRRFFHGWSRIFGDAALLHLALLGYINPEVSGLCCSRERAHVSVFRFSLERFRPQDWCSCCCLTC